MSLAKSKDTGYLAEEAVAAHLQQQGCHIRARNWRHGRAEVDIIAEKGTLLLFIEVKMRRHAAFGWPEAFVTRQQKTRYHEAATAYLEEHPWPGPIRFDIASLSYENGDLQVTLLEDAF